MPVPGVDIGIHYCCDVVYIILMIKPCSSFVIRADDLYGKLNLPLPVFLRNI